MVNIGVNLDSIGDFAQAGIYYENGLALAQEVGDLWSEMRVKNNMGSRYLHSLNDPDRALACWQSALMIAEKMGSRFASATIRFNMACLFYTSGDFERTTPILAEAIQIARDHQFPQMLSATCGVQAMSAVERKDFSTASSLFLEAFEISHAIGYPDALYELIEGTASLCLSQKKYEKLTILLAAVDGRTSLVEVQRVLPLCVGFENAANIARRAMGNESFERAWKIGKSMRYEELYAFARKLFVVEDGTQAQSEALSMLTVRELETLRLLALGKSNEEISRELVVVQKTVEKHVANILRKLGVKNRTEAAAWVIENE
jgi:non-specific serine/threonine protein kinase